MRRERSRARQQRVVAGTAALLPRPRPGVLRLLKEAGAGGRQATKERPLEEDCQGRQGLFCRRCSSRITGEESRMAVNGSHRHTFFNPAGILFELACFRAAPGCLAHGEASALFSWFAGYQWRIALCGRCAAHLGWRFENRQEIFFCLILSHLTDGLGRP